MSYTSRQVILLSSSKVHGYEYLAYAADDINSLFKSKKVSTILFIPYALRNHDKYLQQISGVFQNWGYKVDGLHQQNNQIAAVEKAEALYVGGGNTFQLLKALYDHNLLDIIRKRVLIDGVPYVGSSAGSNVATISINTTNDMPIVYPPSFNALNLVPFNINPHYQDPDANSIHKGETREERIQQYQEIPGAAPVIGLREGSFLSILGNTVTLNGLYKLRLFIPGKQPEEIEVGSDLSYLLNNPA